MEEEKPVEKVKSKKLVKKKDETDIEEKRE
jgi:hypothetical protein